MIIQFARYDPADGQLDFTFPIAFPTACISVQANNIYDAYIGISNFFSVSTTGFRIDSFRGSGDKVLFSIIAIGY